VRAQEVVDVYSSDDAIEEYSTYHLRKEEKYLFRKYFASGTRVLDLACGLGRTTLRLSEDGVRVRGYDLSPVFIERAQKRFPYLDLHVGTYTTIPEPDQSYDGVLISANGLDCAGSDRARVQALRECARVLQSGGTFIFSSHNLKSLHASPYYALSPTRLLWKLRHTLDAFRDHAYIVDIGRANSINYFYGSPAYTIRQVEDEGFRLYEAIGFRASQNPMFLKWVSPYIYYAFERL
jgi:ubiquinone/menaquinone biosynthesis C-methylase UbiE